MSSVTRAWFKGIKSSFLRKYFYKRGFSKVLLKKNIWIFFILYLAFSIYSNEIATKSSSVLLLDGVNFREYSLEHSSDLLSLYKRPLLFYVDTSESSSEKNIERKPIVSMHADLSSETGEPLFLRLIGGDSPNREHGTYGNVTVDIPRIGAQLSGIYNHLGMYADAIEQFCANYEHARGHYLPYRDIGHYGVAEYITGQMKLSVRNVVSKTVFNRYGEWVTIPGLYNPLYKSGNALNQSLILPLLNSQFSVSGMIDRRAIYNDHINSIKKTYYSVNPQYKKTVFSDDTLTARALFSNEKVKGHRAGLEYKHTAETYNVSVSGGLWSSIKPDANVAVTVPFFDSSDVSVMYSLVYIPEERPVTQITPKHTVTTHIKPFNYNEVRLSASLRKCLKLPLTLELWTDYKSSYQSYSIDTAASVLSTKFIDSEEMLFLSGGALRMAFSFESIHLNLWSSGNIIFKGVPFEYVPYECGLGFTHCFRGTNTLQTDFNLTLRGPVQWNAQYSGKDTTRSSSRLLFCDIGLKIPFILPILSSHVSPELVIKAGPICLCPAKRARYHPFGTEIGPLIAVSLTGNIY
ncbi:MAG: hypothetical protein JW915_05655 [Chitinispirillaceae bacterium]|nr:hypothetical protein [Chitinispirillaceae bacterium]